MGVGYLSSRDNRLVVTVDERAHVRERLLALAHADERVVSGAEIGALAADGSDRWSDLDLTFGLADGLSVDEVLSDWTARLADELDAVHLFDVSVRTTTYRVLLLPGNLQVDDAATRAPPPCVHARAQMRVVPPRRRLGSRNSPNARPAAWLARRASRRSVRKTRFPSAACTSHCVQRDESPALLLRGERSLGRDRMRPEIRHLRNSARRRPV